MTTTTQTIDAQKVADILNAGSWDYEHCGDRIKSGDMDEYLDELLDAHFLEHDVANAIAHAGEKEIISAFSGDGDINEFAAVWIGDMIAQSKVDCVYPTVSFLFII